MTFKGLKGSWEGVEQALSRGDSISGIALAGPVDGCAGLSMIDAAVLLFQSGVSCIAGKEDSQMRIFSLKDTIKVFYATSDDSGAYLADV